MKKRIPLLIVISLIILHAVCNFIWLKNDDRPLQFDFGIYFDRSIDLFKSVKMGPKVFIQALLGQGPYLNVYFHPSRIIVPLVSLPAYLFFGLHEDVAVMALVVFFAILALSVYGISKRIIGPGAGVLAVFIVGTMPGIFWLSRHYSSEFVTTAIMALSVYLLIKSDYFSHKGYSALLGISAGLGLLTKGIYFVFILGPLLSAFVTVLVVKENIRPRMFNMIFSASLCVLVASFWYVPYFNTITTRILNVPFSDEVRKLYNMPEILSVQNILFYPVAVINWGASFFYSLLFILGCFRFFHNLNAQSSVAFRQIKYTILMWIVVPYVFLTMVPSKSEEYFNLFYPVMAIVITFAVFSVKRKLLRWGLMVLIVLVGGVQFFGMSYGTMDILPKQLAMNAAGVHITIFKQGAPFLPQRTGWKMGEVLNYIYANRNDRPIDNKRYAICIMPDMGELSVPVGKYHANLHDLPFGFFGLNRAGYETTEKMLTTADFIVTKTGYQGLFLTEERRELAINQIEQSGLFTKLPRDFSFPDGRLVNVYGRVPRGGNSGG
ncbi:MAG: glycosyltransferase family 39 protein [Candidatus Omnitrophica bacterium]|nr:glycosyltransferase family 39 protein [Candidatus Omnitrophota bacterium]